ncbi:MAG TPA: hypothetical protein VF929_09270 [Gemmatimonadaceae bacterium]
MRRTNWKTVSTLVTMVVIAGCQDHSATAPVGATTGPVSVLMAPEGRPQLDRGNNAAGSNNDTTVDFVVPPSGGTFLVGNHAVVFPANSICNPEGSSYGVGTWDDSCEPARGAVKIHAVVRTATSGTWVDFSPALRFVPSSNPRQWVWLFMYNPAVVGATDLSKFTINYSLTIGDAGIDESLTDPSLRTYVDQNSATSLRRIKHFSGYTVSGYSSCDPAADPNCTPVAATP